MYPETMRVTGIDFSLTSTGIAIIDDTVWTTTVKTGKRRGHERLEFLLDIIVQHAADSDLVVMEGISYASFDADKALAGGWWIIKHRLWEENLPVWVVTPSDRMIYATGRGNASKQQVMDWVNGDDFPGMARNDDEADAAVLAAMGRRALGRPVDAAPESHWARAMKARHNAGF